MSLPFGENSADLTNDDVLAVLREAQDAARQDGPGSFAEWRQEALHKARVGAAHISPGVGMMGPPGNTASRAPAGPANRPSGNAGWGYKPPPARQPYDKPEFSTEPWFGNVPGQQFGVPSGGYEAWPDKYNYERPNQPPPWIDDVDMRSIWYSPFQPVWPFGPPYYNVPREWDFPVGYNLDYIPKRLELVGTLRGMRASWGVLAAVLKSRKDQLLRVPWTIQVKGKPRTDSKFVEEMRRFFRRPDGKLSYSQWTRKLLDDLFVIDAPTVFLERNLGGQVNQAQILDGGTIFPLIDDAGRRPDTTYTTGPAGIVYEHRQPAFQQIIYGLPMLNLSEDEIIYAMMHPRPEMPVFGYSPVEQIFTETTEAIRKTFYQLEFWRAGSMPELMVTVPDNWTPRQIAAFQGHFDALLSGQLTLKSKVRFIPGGMKPFDIKNASGESLWSLRDELLVRLVCYAFSVSPAPFMKQVNRSTAIAEKQTAEEEGLYPLMAWWKDDIMDTIIQEKFGYDDVEFTFLPRRTPDQTKEATIHQIQLHDGSRTINEVRAEIGLEPIPDGDYHLLYTGSAIFRLDQVIAGEAAAPGAPKPDGPPRPADPASAHAPAVRGPISGPSKPPTQGFLPETKPTPVHKASRKEVEAAARETDRKPSKLQRKYGNYRKGHISLHSLPITIENAPGSKRKEKDRFGVSHKVTMTSAYGYINGTVGADDMQVDVYIGRHPESNKLWVIDQDKFNSEGEDKGFDEHKVMMGYNKPQKAVKDYLASHYDGMGHERLAAITELSYEDFKRWLKHGDTKKPISEQGYGHVIGRRGKNNGLDAGQFGKADTVAQSTGLLNYDYLAVPARRRKRRKGEKRRLTSGPKWLSLKAEIG